jgi:ATP-dependent helicase/nuclease subunit B
MTESPSNAFASELVAPRYYSIDVGRPFLADLARGLIAAFGEDLPRAEIYLPTRRAVRALSGAILDARAAGGVRASLLPRMRAIGDIDEDEMAVFAGEAADDLDLPPAISGAARTLELARLVAAKDRAFDGHENWPAALAAARELGKLLDSLYAEEVSAAGIAEIDAGALAEHWRVSRDFLEIVTRAWPAFLEAHDLSDPADRRAKLIGMKAARLLAAPPGHPLIIAGTTASAPAVARLVQAIAAAPMGAAVLPGLDRDIDAKAFEKIEDAHPQAGLKALLETIGRGPRDIRPWPGSGGRNPRAGLLGLALRPAEATDEWLGLIDSASAADPKLAQSVEGLTLIEADTEDAEALTVAMLFRETLETEGATAMLVTPDRNLARRVALKMRRWNVTVDDSGGVPFANTPCGTFLRLAAGFLADPGDPVATLALVRHPLARLGLDEPQRGKAVDTLDRALRGVRLSGGLAGVAERASRDDGALAALAVLQRAADLFDAAHGAGFAGKLRAHLGAAALIAGGALWAGDDGAAGAELLEDILQNEGALDAVRPGAYGDVFDALIAGAVVRRRSDAHPRLSILGPLEARLLSADHVILGGLNEGVWPQGAPADPFLSRAMREEVGLPSPERRIGLAAHDFAQGASAARVTLTRAMRAGGAPAKPSRWIVRLKNILEGAGALAAVDQSPLWRARAAMIDTPDAVKPAEAPRPRAGKDRRPATLPVTDIEKWIRDPYAIYAKRLLRLRPLDEPGTQPGPREVGSLLHRVFERAAQEPEAPPIDALRALLNEEALRAGLTGADRVFWSAGLEEALRWFMEFDRGQRAKGQSFVEQQGALTLQGVDPPFTLTARADRIDVLENDEAAIFDYKLSTLPTDKQDKANFSPQLPLTAAILAAGGFPSVPAKSVSEYRYLRMTGREGDVAKDEFGAAGDAAREAIPRAEEELRRWIARFDDPKSAYLSKPRAQFIKRSGPSNADLDTDYDQLARRREWMASEDAEGDGE